MEQQRDSGYYEPLAVLFCVQVNRSDISDLREKKILFRYPFKNEPEFDVSEFNSTKNYTQDSVFDKSKACLRYSVIRVHEHRTATDPLVTSFTIFH